MSVLCLIGLLPALLAPPQDAKPAVGAPASTNIRGAEYPRILEDLRVSFRIKAPDAQKVELPVGNPIEGTQIATMIGALAAATTPEVVAEFMRLAGSR